MDYRDALVRMRVREIIRYIQRLGLPLKLDKIKDEYIADSFYVHYRSPVFRDVNDVSEEDALWYVLVYNYVNSSLYEEVKKISRYNYQSSRSASIKLLRAYNSIISRMERGVSPVLKSVKGMRLQDMVNDPSVRQEMMNVLRFYMGSVKSLDDVSRKLARLFGSEVGKEAAELLFDIDIDPYRSRLASMLESLVKLLSDIRNAEPGQGKRAEKVGTPVSVKHMSTVSELRHATSFTKAIYSASPELFAYKLASNLLSVKEHSVESREKFYILVDKSGSMFYYVGDSSQGGELAQKITWATALALALISKGKRVVVRFFDQVVHKPLTSIPEIIRALLMILPLGGTDISSAVRAAAEDAKRNPAYRGYKLIVITDGEDDSVLIDAFEEAKRFFRDVKVVFIGGRNRVIEGVVKTLRIDSTDSASLSRVLGQI